MPEKMTENQKVSAVICELNPLHLGHLALFRQAKERSGALVCVLSGNFVQRGEPAALDKWARTRLALENGADLVLELPLPWACAGAERFAAGGVHLANALGNVDFLCFGSEESDLSLLERAAEALLSPEFSQRLNALPENGETFARRREAVLSHMLGEAAGKTMRQPNAILAVEYLKALKRENSLIAPLAFPRQGTAHDAVGGADPSGAFRSAMELRELLKKGRPIGGLVPESTAKLVEELAADGKCPADIRHLERAILCKLRAMNTENFAALPDVSEGLENRLYKAARQAGTLEEFYALAKSKRYPHARIRRLALCAFLGVSNTTPALPPYLRVLGMNGQGEKILREAHPSLPIAARPADFQKLGGQALALFQLEAKADDLYALAMPSPGPCGRDYAEKLIRSPLG